MQLVDGNLYSGLTLRLLAEADYNRIDKFRLSLLRKMMRGKACKKTEDTEGTVFRSVKAFEVWKYWNLLPSKIDLLVRRLKRYQAWASWPEHHSQILGAFFGKMKIENDHTTLAEGKLSEHANPWAIRLQQDLQDFAEKDDEAASLLDFIGANVCLIFTDRECREDFVKLDPGSIRARFNSVAIPPLGSFLVLRLEI